jgi:hypothetical protein
VFEKLRAAVQPGSDDMDIGQQRSERRYWWRTVELKMKWKPWM